MTLSNGLAWTCGKCAAVNDSRRERCHICNCDANGEEVSRVVPIDTALRRRTQSRPKYLVIRGGRTDNDNGGGAA
jgi:hypothetical protein